MGHANTTLIRTLTIIRAPGLGNADEAKALKVGAIKGCRPYHKVLRRLSMLFIKNGPLHTARPANRHHCESIRNRVSWSTGETIKHPSRPMRQSPPRASMNLCICAASAQADVRSHPRSQSARRAAQLRTSYTRNSQKIMVPRSKVQSNVYIPPKAKGCIRTLKRQQGNQIWANMGTD